MRIVFFVLFVAYFVDDVTSTGVTTFVKRTLEVICDTLQQKFDENMEMPYITCAYDLSVYLQSANGGEVCRPYLSYSLLTESFYDELLLQYPESRLTVFYQEEEFPHKTVLFNTWGIKNLTSVRDTYKNYAVSERQQTALPDITGLALQIELQTEVLQVSSASVLYSKIVVFISDQHVPIDTVPLCSAKVPMGKSNDGLPMVVNPCLYSSKNLITLLKRRNVRLLLFVCTSVYSSWERYFENISSPLIVLSIMKAHHANTECETCTSGSIVEPSISSFGSQEFVSNLDFVPVRRVSDFTKSVDTSAAPNTFVSLGWITIKPIALSPLIGLAFIGLVILIVTLIRRRKYNVPSPDVYRTSSIVE